MTGLGAYSVESLTHFHCVSCSRWWTIADIPNGRVVEEWYCPWCGYKQLVEDKSPTQLR